MAQKGIHKTQSSKWLRGWSRDRLLEPADNQEDTVEQAGDTDDTGELSDTPRFRKAASARPYRTVTAP